MGFFKRNWWRLLLSLLLAAFAFIAADGCHVGPPDLVSCEYFFLIFVLYASCSFFLNIITTPISLFAGIFTPDHATVEMQRRALVSGLSTYFSYLALAGIFYALISHLSSQFLQKRTMEKESHR